MAGTKLAELPDELLLAILRQLKGSNPAALLAIARVSRGVHPAAISTLYSTIILDTLHRIRSLAEVASAGSPHLALVRNLSPWADLRQRSEDETMGQVNAIITACPNLVSIQVSHTYLRDRDISELLHTRGIKEMFVWMARDWTLVRNGLFSKIYLLHLADLQSWAVHEAGSYRKRELWLDFLRDSLSPAHFPVLRMFSTTIAPSQFFNDSEATWVQDTLQSFLAISSLERFVVRMVGPDTQLGQSQALVPFLVRLRSPKIRLLPYDERHPILADNLLVWTHNAAGRTSMWNCGVQVYDPDQLNAFEPTILKVC